MNGDVKENKLVKMGFYIDSDSRKAFNEKRKAWNEKNPLEKLSISQMMRKVVKKFIHDN